MTPKKSKVDEIETTETVDDEIQTDPVDESETEVETEVETEQHPRHDKHAPKKEGVRHDKHAPKVNKNLE